jgi:hypothetical protein
MRKWGNLIIALELHIRAQIVCWKNNNLKVWLNILDRLIAPWPDGFQLQCLLL